MAEQFVVELGWLQERTFPLELAQPPRATLSAHNLLELADSFYRYRMERWTLREAGRAGHVRALEAETSDPLLPNYRFATLRAYLWRRLTQNTALIRNRTINSAPS